jgi:hypothetical protein
MPNAREHQAEIRAASQKGVVVPAALLGDFVYEVSCERHPQRRVTGDKVAEAARQATHVGHPVRVVTRMFSRT